MMKKYNHSSKILIIALIIALSANMFLIPQIGAAAAFNLTANLDPSSPETGVRLDWAMVAGAASYEVYINDGQGEQRAAIIDVNESRDYLSYSFSSLTPATTYTFRVRALNSGASEIDVSPNAVITTRNISKPIITSSRFDINNRNITLMWQSNSSAVASSIIKRQGGPTLAAINSAAAAGTFSDPAITNDTPVRYVVVSQDSASNLSPDSDPVTVTPIAAPVVTASMAYGVANINWGDFSHIDKFSLERSKFDFAANSGAGAWGTWEVINSQLYTGMQWVNDNPGNPGVYRYRLNAKSTSGYTGYSNISPSVTRTAAPASLTCQIQDQVTISLSWINNPAIDSQIRVERKTGYWGTYQVVATLPGSAATFQDNFNYQIHNTYYYRVTAYDSDNNKSESAESSVYVTIPYSPSSLNLNVASESQINLGWTDNSNNEQGFKIERRVDSGNFIELAVVGANVTAYIDNSGISAGHTYTYRVRSYNLAGNSYSYSNEVSTTSAVLSTPSSLELNPVSPYQIDLSWTYPGVTNYETVIERKNGAAGTWSTITVISAGTLSYSDYSLSPGTKYYYRIKSRSGYYIHSREFPDSLGMAAYTQTSALNAVVVSTTRVDLSWSDKFGNEVNYKVERKTDAGSYQQIALLPPNSAAYSDNIPASDLNHVYSYRISVVDSDGSTIFTNRVPLTTSIISAPVSLKLTSVSSSQLDLNWSYNGTEKYNTIIERKIGAGGDWTVLNTVAAGVTQYSDYGLTQNTQYFYRVRAKAGAYIYSAVYPESGEEGYTNLSTLRLSILSSSSVELAWNDYINSELGFKVERKVDDGAFADLASLPENAVSYTDNAVDSMHAYTYRISCYSVTGASIVYTNSISYTSSDVTAAAAINASAALKATPVSSTQMELEWSYTGHESYNTIIERKTGTNGNWSVIATAPIGASKFSDAGLSNNTQYFYRIKAKGESGKYLGVYPNNPETYPYGGIEAYTIIAALTAAVVSPDQVDLSWEDNLYSETGFILQRKTDAGNFADIKVLEPNTTKYSDKTVATGHTYTYRVRSIAGGKVMLYTNELIVQSTALNPPTSLEVTPASTSSMEIAWSYAGSGNNPTVVERKIGKYGVWAVISAELPSGTNVFKDEGLTTGVQYFYRVRSTSGAYVYSQPFPNNSNGEGAYTVMSWLYLTVASGTQINLRWSDVLNDELNYRVQRKTDQGSFTDIATLMPNAIEYSDKTVSPGHNYAYRVCAVSSDNTVVVYSNSPAATSTAPSMPMSLELTPLSPTQIDLVWSYPGVESYNTVIERRTGTNGSWVEIANMESGITRYSDAALNPNTQYFYRVKSKVGSYICSATYPNDNTGKNAYTLLKNPTNLTAAAVSSSQISLSWSDNSDETEFVIERRTSTEDFAAVATVNANVSTWVDTSVKMSTSYTYRVMARTQSSSSAYSNETSVTSKSMDEPTSLTAEVLSDSSVKLVWNDNSNTETGFEIWRKVNEQGPWELHATVSRNRKLYIDEGLSSDNRYFYKVRAYITQKNIYSEYSNEAAAKTVMLAAPTELTAKIIAGQQIDLSWKDNTADESGFKVERKTYDDGEWIEVSSLAPDINKYTSTGLAPYTKYYFRVKVFNITNGNYAYSEEVEVFTGLPDAPYGLMLEAVSANQIRLKWSESVENEKGFAVERKGPGESYREVGRVNAGTTSYFDSKLEPDTIYYYRVKSIGENGDSEYCREVYIRTKKVVTYEDIDEVYWAKDAIENLASRGVINGWTDKLFAPDDNITRAEFVVYLVKACGLNRTPVGSFEDVKPGDWFYKEVVIAKALGILPANYANRFEPESPISREEVAYIVDRALKSAGKPLKGYQASIMEKYMDFADISISALSSLASLVGENIMGGRYFGGNRLILPKGSITRVDAIMIIYKIIDR